MTLAAPFNAGLAEQVVRFQRCEDCQAAMTLPRYACTRCGSTRLAWRDASGGATVYAVTEVARAPSDEFRPLAPYTLVIVTLDEGPRLMGHALPGTAIGDRVSSGFFEHNGRHLIRFQPAAPP
jgi:uncharacterized OB-fold protein